MYQVGLAYLDTSQMTCTPDNLSLNDVDFFQRFKTSKEDMLSKCILYFYIRKTTKKGGLERGMFVDSRSGVAKARSYDSLWGPVNWTVTESPKRWIRTLPHPFGSYGSPESVGGPILHNNQQLLFNDLQGVTHAANVRWGTTGEYIVPKGNFYDHDCEFITTAPAFRNANLKFMGKQKIKTGAGFMVKAAEAYYPEREYDNHRFNNLITMQGKPQDFYVPIQYTRPQAIPPTSLAAGITLNYPIHGFLHTLSNTDILPIGYVSPNPFTK
jgi:hypothetical protein